ncbi:TPA: phosphoenolpyruvate carboxylase [Candidatus Woesearchaeota archaeon]|nr:phosphoenolpyruvate carboxylase [Candidatus Woesearchaeota archaeon]
MRKIPRTLSTQHPDNVSNAPFAAHSVIGGEAEIKEAYYAFSALNCDEQLWDSEGKETDNYVVKKLLSENPDYFKKKRLGRDKQLLLRVPNPTVEGNEAKLLLEILESIPRSYDVAHQVYDDTIAPIFEVAIPMVTSERCPIRVAEYYKQFVVGKQAKKLFPNDIPLSKWIGEFKPDTLRVIPLFETKEAILDSAKIVEKFVKFEKIDDYQRVWLARSDPALNYGNLSALLLCKVALQRLHAVEQKLGIEIYPMIGVGTAPFRGNFKPTQPEKLLKGYPSVQTFTPQSAFKYDYPEKTVKNAIETINNTKRKKPVYVDEEKTLKIIDKIQEQYEKEIIVLAPYINRMSQFVPRRRLRKLHIGLFGYSRKSERGLVLPRAITFCASMYSIGLPPELLGLTALNDYDTDALHSCYANFEYDLKEALSYLNKANLEYLPDMIKENVLKIVKEYGSDSDGYDENTAHNKITSKIMHDFRTESFKGISDDIVEAGRIRKFLG